MKRILFTILLLAGLAGELLAQDPQFSQFHSMPLYLNPGFTGSAPMHRLNTVYRMQWPNLPKAFSTAAVSYDYNMQGLNSGIGMMFTHDNAGETNLTASSFSGFYSYKLHFRNDWVVTPGIQFGYVSRNFDYSKLLLNDQIGFGSSGQVPGTIDPTVLGMENISYFDFGTGLLLYNKTSWIGASVYHLNEPNQSLMGGDERLSAKYSVHGGMRIPLYKGPMVRKNITSIAPSFIYKRQSGFQQMDLGLHFHYNPVMVGAWYRGIIGKNEYNYGKQNAVILLFGVRVPKLEFGYSYDFTLSALGPASGGAHEITLGYIFKTDESKKMKRRDKFIPCPTFLPTI